MLIWINLKIIWIFESISFSCQLCTFLLFAASRPEQQEETDKSSSHGVKDPDNSKFSFIISFYRLKKWSILWIVSPWSKILNYISFWPYVGQISNDLAPLKCIMLCLFKKDIFRILHFKIEFPLSYIRF